MPNGTVRQAHEACEEGVVRHGPTAHDEMHTTLVYQGRVVVIGGGGDPLVLDEAAGAWVHDPDLVPPLPGIPPDVPLYAAMIACVPIG